MRHSLRLTFPEHLIKEPVVFTMARKYDLMPNISRARVTENFGEMLLELEGTEENLNEGMRFLKDRGIGVELVKENLTE